MTFTTNESLAPLSTTRLNDSTRQHAYALPSASAGPATPRAPSPLPSSHPIAIPTMRKSFRKILSAVSGIRVRMRTTFVPHLTLPDSPSESWEDQNDERTVILSVEVENAGRESKRGFEVETVKVIVGSPADGAKAILIGWGTPGEKMLFGEEAEKAIFPLKLRSVEQYNLLYAVTFAGVESPGTGPWPSNSYLGGGRMPSDSTPTKPLSIIISGRPWDPPSEEDSTPALVVGATCLLPNRPFASRWSSILDLAAASQITDNRPSSPLSDRDALPVPASPFPQAVEASTPVIGRKDGGGSRPFPGMPDAPPASPIAGSKRHTIAGLQQRSERMSLGRKLLMASHRASTPTPSSMNKSLPPINTTPTHSLQPPLQITVPPGSPSLSHVRIQTGPPMSPSPLHRPSTPTTPLSQHPIATSLGTSGPIVVPKRQKVQNGQLPPIPYQTPDRRDMPGSTGTIGTESSLMISISLVFPSAYNTSDGISNQDKVAPSSEKIHPLDVFALDIFVFNRSLTRTRRCVVSHPERRRKTRPVSLVGHTVRGSQGDRASIPMI